MIFAVFAEFRCRRIQPDADIRPAGSCRFNGGNNILDGLFVGFQIRGKSPFISDPDTEPLFLEDFFR